MISKYDKLSIQRNPFREYSKPIQHNYNKSKYSQLRIYFKCESFYFKSKESEGQKDSQGQEMAM